MAWGIPSIGFLYLLATLALAPLAVLVFRPWRMPGGLFANLGRIVRDYWGHFAVFAVLYPMKNYVDSLNDPIRGVFGDFTFLIHRLEGDLVLHLQDALAFDPLTAVLNANYLLGYIFLTYFSVILATYADDRELANKMILNVFVIYLLSIPFYIFFNVQITSDYLPGMSSLLYHSSSTYLSFFTAVDPLDNAWPSLHIGIPFGFLLLLWWTMRDRAQTLATFPYRRFLIAVAVLLCVFAFSILYLGIHWILDIPGGLVVGALGAAVVDEIHDDVFGKVYALGDHVAGLATRVKRRICEVTASWF